MGETQSPMGGASPAPAANDPMMGGEDPMMGGDPNMGGEDPMMGGEPNMGDEDPMMGGDPNMGDEDPMMGNDDESNIDDSTMSIINQLSPEDREAVRSYAESMLNHSESSSDESQDNMSGSEPMMESYIFSKKQLTKIMEGFGPTEDEIQKKDNKGLNKKKAKSISKNSPFNSPKFN